MFVSPCIHNSCQSIINSISPIQYLLSYALMNEDSKATNVPLLQTIPQDQVRNDTLHLSRIISTLHSKEATRVHTHKWVLKVYSIYNQLPILSADTYTYILWNILNLLIIAFYLFQIGLLLGFGEVFWHFQASFLLVVNWLFLLIMLLDILMGPLRSYYDAGVVILDRNLLLLKYRSYLLLDAVAVVGVAVPYFTGTLYMNLFKLLFLGRLYRAYEMDNQLKVAVQLRTTHYLWFSVGRLLLLALLLSHYLGIAFYWVDYIVYKSNYYGVNTPAYCWLYSAHAQSTLIVSQPWYIVYLYTMYYSIGNITTIAYGDIVPLNAWETLVANAIMIASILVFTYFFKSVIQAFFFDSLGVQHHRNVLQVINYIIDCNRMEKSIAEGIKAHCQQQFEKKPLMHRVQSNKLINKLPQSMRGQLLKYTTAPLITQLGLAMEHTSVQYKLLIKLQSRVLQPGTVLAENDIVYYIRDNGRVKVEGVAQSFPSAISLHHGYEFMQRIAQDYSIITDTTTEITQLAYASLEDIRIEAEQRDIEQFALVKYSSLLCCLCGEKGHRLKQCKYVQCRQQVIVGKKWERKGKNTIHAWRAFIGNQRVERKQQNEKQQYQEMFRGKYFCREEHFKEEEYYQCEIFKIEDNISNVVEMYNLDRMGRLK